MQDHLIDWPLCDNWICEKSASLLRRVGQTIRKGFDGVETAAAAARKRQSCFLLDQVGESLFFPFYLHPSSLRKPLAADR